MPPEENTNINKPSLDTFQVGIDPVFKGNPSQQKKTEAETPVSAFNVLSNQQYTPATPPASSFELPKSNPLTPKSIVRTYKGDLAEAIQIGHLSSINIAIAENERMHEQIKTGSAEPVPAGDYSRSKIIIFISLILVVLGIIGLSIVYFVKNQNPGPAIQVQTLPSLITAEFHDEINTTGLNSAGFVSALSGKLNDTQITVNNLYNIYLTVGTGTAKRLLTSQEFVALTGFNMPDIIKRTLLPDFMVGTFSFGKNLPFIILKTSYFENAYAGMLSWESNLEKDLLVLFRLPGYENSGNILAELKPATTKKFEDGVIVNKDVRLIRDDSGNIILLYGIIDKETIIITVNDTAFKEIVNRLDKEKSLKR